MHSVDYADGCNEGEKAVIKLSTVLNGTMGWVAEGKSLIMIILQWCG